MSQEIAPTTPSAPAVDRAATLLASAEAKGDKEEYIYSAELYLLNHIASTSSDLVKAREWDEFREIHGGIEGFEAAHRAAVGAWERWHADGFGG